MFHRYALPCVALVSWAAGASDQRPFRMGFTPFPWDASLEAVEATDRFVAANGDVVCHHFDGGVPWTEALAGQPYCAEFEKDWARRRELSRGRKVFVALTPLSGDRGSLALYRGEKENMALPAAFAGKPLNAPAVKAAFLSHARRAVTYFKPDWLAIGIEVNELLLKAPAAWPQFLELHRETAAALKKEHPNLPLCATVTLHGLIDPKKQNLNGQAEKVKEFLATNDFAGLSYHPFMAGVLAETEKPLDWARSFTDKPIAICETSFPAETLRLDSFKLTLPSDPARQEAYLEALLGRAGRDRYLFVVYFLYRDYDLLWEKLKVTAPEFFKAWKDCGLVDGLGKERPAYRVWKRCLELKVPNGR